MSAISHPPTRRALMALAAAAVPGALAGAQTEAGSKPLVFPGKRPMIVRNDFPECLESLPEYLSTWITPNDAFFVRQHLPRPKVNVGSFTVEVSGMVKQPVKLSLGDLRALPQHAVPATLECAGNGRGNFRPRMPGLQWRRGAIGNAEWRGPRLKDVLERAGASSNAAYATFNGADIGGGMTPDFIRSIPMRKAMDDATILAIEMNGQPLPDLHGAPVRLIVPGWDGASWVKWVNDIRIAGEPDTGFFMNPAYRFPRNPVTPGTAPRPEDLEVIEGMAVKSFFALPERGTRLPRGPLVLRGAAWGGENRITRVEVSTDGGMRWAHAELSREDVPFTWRTWAFRWTPERLGYFTLCCRATDSAGRVQPIEAVWNPSGYLWNSIDRVGVTVEG